MALKGTATVTGAIVKERAAVRDCVVEARTGEETSRDDETGASGLMNGEGEGGGEGENNRESAGGGSRRQSQGEGVKVESEKRTTCAASPNPIGATGGDRAQGGRDGGGVGGCRGAYNADSKRLVWWHALQRKPYPFCNLVAVGFSCCVVLVASLLQYSALGRTTPSLVISSHLPTVRSINADSGAVAADEARCSAVGLSILKAGGNAVDSAVAATLCLGVLNPMASGIGGGVFILIRLANGSVEVIDGRETAPAGASQDMFANKDKTSSLVGGLSVAVPGELPALYLAWQRYGSLPWRDLVQPAIRLAAEGFLVSNYLHHSLQMHKDMIMKSDGLSRMFAPGGEMVRAGDWLTNKRLAFTLSRVAELGPSALYAGPLGHALATDVQREGGILTVDDLAGYQPVIRAPLVTEQNGLTVIGAPPPSSGGPPLIEMMKILSGFPRAARDSGAGLHRTVEAMKHVFALRMGLGDPAFNNNNATLAVLMSEAFAAAVRANISDTRTFPPEHYYYGGPGGGRWAQLNDSGTTHLSIVDCNRNAVSLTSTINTPFGSKLLSASTGILLNNEMADFSIPGQLNKFGVPPSEANFIAPGKRCLSSMSPLIVLQGGQLRAVLGGSGGPYIITATAQVLLNFFSLGLSPWESILAPRVHHQLLPHSLNYESNHAVLNGAVISLSRSLVDALTRRGHDLIPVQYGGAIQMIVQELENPPRQRIRNSTCAAQTLPGVAYGRLTAVSDPRKDGAPAGY
eukprot:TRINITY_DN29538_c0_g1_i1.p1 TRINITY_DN29538_c0_g1~~TRINITY_DN29538_c0_g1_i1.p1  ORF type:complete len:745 (-),score=113.16 TRINITY_DN29538_c0_g1_i1:523-2757(-)